MIAGKTVFGNGAMHEVHYYRQRTLERAYPNASPQDVIRLKVTPAKGYGKGIDFFMTPGEAIDIASGLLNALQHATTDDVAMWHEDEL